MLWDLECSPEEKAKIEEIQKATGLGIKDVLNNAFSLLSWAVDQRRAKRQVASMDPKTQEFEFVEIPHPTPPRPCRRPRIRPHH